MDARFPPTQEEGRRGQLSAVVERIKRRFGKRAKIDVSSVSRWRDGTSTPTLDNVFMLEVALGLAPGSIAFPQGTADSRLDRLIEGEDEPEIEQPVRKSKRRAG